MISGTAIILLIIIGVPVMCATAIAIACILKGKSSQMTADETRTLQQIHQGLLKMEKRIDALESIVIDRDKQREHSEL